MFTVLLICAVLASLAAGVLAAYGVCVAIFATIASQSRRPARAQAHAAAPASGT